MYQLVIRVVLGLGDRVGGRKRGGVGGGGGGIIEKIVMDGQLCGESSTVFPIVGCGVNRASGVNPWVKKSVW